DDRPPLGAPRPRRTRARAHPPRRPQPCSDEATSTPWTPGGRQRGTPPPNPATETASTPELTRSPLTDSNRRPLVTIGSSGATTGLRKGSILCSQSRQHSASSAGVTRPFHRKRPG